MDDKKPVYRLSGFYPRIGGSNPLDRFNFAIYLDADFAKKCLRVNLEDFSIKRYQEEGHEILKATGYSWRFPYEFFRGSLLVDRIQINSGDRSLGVNQTILESLAEGKAREKSIVYNSQNVDNSVTAYSLLACFEKWLFFTDVFLNPR